MSPWITRWSKSVSFAVALWVGATSAARAGEGGFIAPPPALAPTPLLPPAPDDPWRAGTNTVAFNLGIGSAVGVAGLTYSRLIGSLFETELGVGQGFTGIQLSLMQKIAVGVGRARFIMGVGLAYSPGGPLVDGPRERSLWLNLDLAGIEVRTSSHFVFFASIGDTHVIGAPLELLSIDCSDSTTACANASHDFPQVRLGFGASF